MRCIGKAAPGGDVGGGPERKMQLTFVASERKFMTVGDRSQPLELPGLKIGGN